MNGPSNTWHRGASPEPQPGDDRSMEPVDLSARHYLRTLLVLGRASNLPTVWSNCLAGWILGGESDLYKLLLLCAGATFIYLGGMYLNDAFDAQFDQQHRPERPIPSGAMPAGAVWAWGFG